MRVKRCSNCQEPLAGLANYCAKCGKPLFAEEQSPDYPYDENQLTVKLVDRLAELKVPYFYKKKIGTGANTSTQPLGSRSRATPVTPAQDELVSSNGAAPTVLQIDDQLEFGDDYDLQRHATWNKTVTYRSRYVPPAPVTPLSEEPATPPLFQEVPPRAPRRLPIRLFSWISVLALISLLLGGIFGIVITLGRGQPAHGKGVLTLQVAPSKVALGETVALRGSNFSPSGRVGLTRDTDVPVVDTGGNSIIHADKTGSFSDTVMVDPSWEPGQHIIRAEDARMHRSATFTVIATGQGVSLRPPHLVFSTSSIDLGSGDQATNSAQTISLSNAGGGQITWQATATEPWLLISPRSGTFSYGRPMQVTIAGDRSNLKVGPYTAGMFFTSNAGQADLPVKMGVEALRPEHEAVLQLTPPVLTFNGTDGNIDPPGQIVTVSNPGMRPLQWSASSATSDGSSWLAVNRQSGTVAKGNSQPVTVSVNIGSLLPGFYNGSVTFTGQGREAVQDSPQTIYVSLTIVPQCALQVSPGELTFTGVYLQPAPASQNINIGVTQGCSTPLSWSTFVTMNNGGYWLSLSSTSGTTPADPFVNITVTGLAPGTYSGSVTFIWSGGTQTLPVTFVLGQATTPLLTTTPSIVTFTGVIGQPNPLPQVVTVTNSGGGTLNWQATTTGGAWLSVMPPSNGGILASEQTVQITIKVALLKTLLPGTYNGIITITGTASPNPPAASSPQIIPVTFVVQAPCAITATPPALAFQGVIGQPNPAAQPVTLAAGGACTNALSWTATTATTPAGGAWLSATPASGTVGLTTSSATKVGIALAGLTAGNYAGTVTITAVDSVTRQPVGAPQIITVNLVVQPQCTLQSPSQLAETFSSEHGFNPVGSQTFTIGVIGSCVGTVTVIPTATMGNGAGWLAVSPASATLASGTSKTFTVTVTSAALAAGSYTGSISLAAINGGITIAGSPQAVGVTLHVLASPKLTASQGLSFNVPTGTSSQQITIANAGGAPLNWIAALDPAAPSFISLSATSGTNLPGGTSTPIGVNINATGLAGGSSYTTSVTITALDALTGSVVVGSPATVAVTITIAPPQMTLSAGSLAFTTTAGSNPAAQTITIQNTGGDTLSWTVGTPSASWLSVTPASGSDSAQATSTITFSVNAAGLSPGTDNATVVITPTHGTAVTVQVTLTVN